MPKLLTFDDFCEPLKEIQTPKIFGTKKKFHSGGLFSEHIFGPLKNYTCQCDIYYGVSEDNPKACETCGVEIVNSSERRKRFAKITLPIKIVNPIFYDLLVELGGKNLKKALDDLMKNEKSILYIDHDGEAIVTLTPERLPKKVQTFEKDEAILKLIEYVSNLYIEEGVVEWKMIKDNLDNLMIDKIIVLPPDLRPSSTKTTGQNKMDRINSNYIQILTKREIMLDTIIDIKRDKQLYYTYFKQLQQLVNDLYQKILEKMAKKEGLIRGNILGKRIDFSGRAVITPDPTLNLDECVLPYLMVLEIYKLPIAKRIIELGKFKLLNKAIDFVDDCIEMQSPVLYKVCEDVIKNEYCILNRQPSLHRLGMLSFKIKISLDNVIKIHPMVCPPFNADFDGDQMAVYVPITEDARKEVREKILITKNLSSPANEELTTTPSQDIILGIFALTSKKFDDLKEEIDYKGHIISMGEAEFNNCLPDDYEVVKGEVNKNKLIAILNDVKDKYNDQVTRTVLDNIKKLGFKYSTLFGCTMSLSDCKFDGVEGFRKHLYDKPSIREQLNAVSDPKLNKELKKKFVYSYFIDSGARGSWDQVKQLILTRGFISNFEGEILPLPIKHSLIDGLTQEEFFYSTYGCRKGLLDVALNTGTSGYLSRKLIFTCANLQLDMELDDCGTEDFLEVDVKNEKKAKMLTGRWVRKKDGSLALITKNNWNLILGKKIKIRSPILCKSPKICKKCYGELYKSINSRFIGILAAQTLGESSTQLVLRTFHTSGSAIIKGEAQKDSEMKQQDIIGDLAAVATILHKFKNKNYVKIVDELFDVYNKNIYHVHYECVVAQLMWVNYRKWRLLSNRNKIKPNYYSIQSVPNQESWILAMAFSNPRRSILQGIMYEGRYYGVLDKILKGEKIE
jgi:DNA-directed RNA polymerase subunit beta'